MTGIAAGHDKAVRDAGKAIAEGLREVAAAVRDTRALEHQLAVVTQQRDIDGEECARLREERNKAIAQCQWLHQDGLTRAEWHAKHCGAVEGAEQMRRERDEARAEVERLRDQLADARASEGAARDAVDAAEEPARLAERDARAAAWEVTALREIGPTLRKIWGAPSDEVRQVLDGLDVLTEQAQDARGGGQEASEGVAGGDGGSGGLGGRLRAAADYQDRPGAYDELRAMADEADEVEAAYRVADAEIARLTEFHDHYRAQVERVRALADEYARGRGGPTAKRIREALDEPKGENEGA